MKKQKVLITGGNKGIGLSTTRKFLKNDFKVFIVARDFTSFKLKNNSAIEIIEFDLRETRKIFKLVEKVGNIDILINNAGIMNALPYNDYSEDKKEEILKVNLEAPVTLIKEFSKGMISEEKGRIVNIASIAGEIGHPDIWYGITKAGMINITKSFAKILGPKGIVINAVAPGPVDTNMLKTIPENRKTSLKKVAILQRFAKPEEVAETIYWLATDSPEYINGICIDVNNGVFMR